MPTVLFCGADAVVKELAESAVWRDGLDRQLADNLEAALTKAASARPALIVVDRDMPRAEALIQRLRANAATQRTSIVVVAAGDLQMEELGLISAGANAVLRLPPGPEWEARIARLLRVPARKETRVPVLLGFEATVGARSLEGRVLNMSQTGMLLECAAATVPLGSELAFSFELPGFEATRGDIRGRGRVVRLAGSGRLGIEFVELEEMGQELLRRFLLVP